MKSKNVIPNLVSRHIQNTDAGEIVVLESSFLCNLTSATLHGVGLTHAKIYISTRVIKHIYDKRTAEEFDFLARNLHLVFRFPDQVYENKSSKRGQYVFVKTIKDQLYFASLEYTTRLEVVTTFRIRKLSYLNNYQLMWSWRDDTSSS